MTRPAIALLCLIALASGVAGVGPSLLFASEKDPKQVLILHSYHVGLNWTDDIMAGIRDVFSQQLTSPQMYVEYMDSQRNESPVYLSQVLENFLVSKFRNKRFDLLLLSDNNALNFVRKHRDDLFAGIPVVFCGINNFTPSLIEGLGSVTGVAEMPEIGKTIDLALKLHPETEEIIFIGRTEGVTGLLNDELYHAAARDLEGALTVTFWNDMSLEELQTKLPRLGAGRLVFLGSAVKTANGRILPFIDSARKVREASSIPLYSFWDIFLGEGIVGGKLVSGLPQGRLAAQLALRVLNGENPEAIKVATSESNAYMFDYRELKRFDISLKALPEGSVVVHRPSPFYEISEKQLWAALIFMVSLSVAFLVTMLGRMRAVKALRINEEQFRSVINSCPMGIYQYRLESDDRLVLTGANPATDAILGVENQTFIGKTIEEAFPNLDETEVPERYREACTQGSSWHAEQIDYEGQYIKGGFEVYAFPTGPGMMACMFTDITERKQAHEALQESEERFRSFFESAASGMVIIDLEGRALRVNPTFCRLSGYSEAETLEMNILEVTHPDDREKTRHLYDEIRVGRRRVGDYEKRYLCKDGSVVWGHSTVAGVFGPDGALRYFAANVQDITESKRAQDQVRESKQMLQLVLDYIPQHVSWKDRDSVYLGCNSNFARAAGVEKPQDLIGKTDYDLAWKREEADFYRECDRRVMEADMPELHIIEPQHQASGKQAWLDTNKIPLHDGKDRVVGILGTFEDITERKQAEEKLKETNRELDAFVYTVSHDLRSPLTPIIGYADFLRENYSDRLDEQALDCLAEISTSGGKMVALMEDLLTLAKVGQIERPARPVDVNQVVQGVAEELGSLISDAGLMIIRESLPALQVTKTLLAQIFDNLIGNAVRYAGREGGPIEIGGERSGKVVRFFVRDHGPGIPAEESSRIFEVFFRGTTGKMVRGTGVGLAIVQKIARLYGGRAWVEETHGGGCTFWVEMEDVTQT